MPSAAKAEFKTRQTAAVNRCATQKQGQRRFFPQAVKRQPDTNRVLHRHPGKKETGRLGPVSEAPVAMRLHRTARLVQRMAGVVHVRLFISRQQSVQRSEETCVSDAATMGPVSRFCAAVLMAFATSRNKASLLVLAGRAWPLHCCWQRLLAAGCSKCCTVRRVWEWGRASKKITNLSELGPQKCYNSRKSAESTAEESSSSH